MRASVVIVVMIAASASAMARAVYASSERPARSAVAHQASSGRSAQSLALPAAGASADRGKQIYLRVGCYQCHGRAGQGAPASGPRLGPQGLALDPFVHYVRQPRGEMPPYTARILTDAELADIHAFLRSLPRPAPAASVLVGR
jgi:mono/diheme cytochrome c family protein